MVKKLASFDVDVKDIERYLTELFEAAKFEVQREQRPSGRHEFDLIVAREDLGRQRRYAIDLSLNNNPDDLPLKFERLSSYAYGVKQQRYDEYWLVSKVPMPEGQRHLPLERYRNIRAFTIEELEKLLGRLSPKRPKAKARTKIGKAIEANEKAILLAIEALRLQIDSKIKGLQGERPNDPDVIDKLNGAILELKGIDAELERIKIAVQEAGKKNTKEKELIEVVGTFKNTVGKWWYKNHDSICTETSKSALFIGLTSLLHLVGADSGAAVVVLGGLIGGEKIGKVLKSIPRNIFRSS